MSKSIDLQKKIKELELLLAKEREEKEMLANIIAKMPEHVYWLDRNNVYLGCNDLQLEHAGLKSRDEIIGKTNYDLPWKKEADELNRSNNIAMETGVTQTFEETATMTNGFGYYLTSKTPLKNSNNEVIGVLGISINITDRKKAEEELRVAKEKAEVAKEVAEEARREAEAANEYKSQFMQNMEHDLRTPTMGIAGYTKVLEDKVNDPEVKKGLELLSEAGEKLLKMLNDIIHASHASAGKFPVCSKKIDLLKVVNDVIDLERPTITVKNLKLDFDYQPDVPQIILSDEHRITRILLNLLSNAVKFTKQGSIKIELSVAEKIDDRHVVLKLTVKDTGMGIPAKLQATMYDRFVRGTPANQGIYQGAGLGLSIVKEFLEELKGKISVESKVDQGTTFTCLIPVALPSATKQSATKVLLIEQHSFSATLASHFIKANLPQAQIEIAETELAAIDLIKHKDYNLIFIGMSWYHPDSCRVIRLVREITKRPIAVLTSDPLEEVEDTFRLSGATEVINASADDAKQRFALLEQAIN